jgi:hypothetical protein
VLIEAVKVVVVSSVDPENTNSGYVIVEKAVKVHEEVLRMAITADTVLFSGSSIISASRGCESM